MKIVHIAPNAPYNEGWGYQENLLPKHQAKLGHDVTLIITNREHYNGTVRDTKCVDFVMNDGVRLIRRQYKRRFTFLPFFFNEFNVYDLLLEIKPDFIFFHGLLSRTIFQAIKYKKRYNKNCTIVQDNHLDYNIGCDTRYGLPFKQKILRLYYRLLNKESIKYVDKVYGVTPWRKSYAEDYFKIPTNKTDVLIMGADDEKIDFSHRESIRHDIRVKYGIKDSDFLIVTGGKIDKKKNIHVLMSACKNLNGVKLLVFGEVLDDIKDEFNDELNRAGNIIYIGWVAGDKVYDYFIAADLVFFPGGHSVLWEQACACKVPCVFKKWDGMDHVNNGGNSCFVEHVNEDSLREKVLDLVFTEKYFNMKRIAESERTDIYLYSNIAKKSLECLDNND